MTLPAELLAIAQATRATFGPKVALKFAADERTGQTWGNAGYDPRDSLEAKRRAGDVIEPDFDTSAAEGVTVVEHAVATG